MERRTHTMAEELAVGEKSCGKIHGEQSPKFM